MNQGWQCPVCRTVYAPWVAQCVTCVDRAVVSFVPPTPVIPLPVTYPPMGGTGETPEWLRNLRPYYPVTTTVSMPDNRTVAYVTVRPSDGPIQVIGSPLHVAAGLA